MREAGSGGSYLRKARLARGWSQVQLAAKLCDVSGHPTVTRSEVARWERQVRQPCHFWRIHLGTVFGVPQHYFLVRRGELAPRLARLCSTTLDIPGLGAETERAWRQASEAAEGLRTMVEDMRSTTQQLMEAATVLDSGSNLLVRRMIERARANRRLTRSR